MRVRSNTIFLYIVKNIKIAQQAISSLFSGKYNLSVPPTEIKSQIDSELPEELCECDVSNRCKIQNK